MVLLVANVSAGLVVSPLTVIRKVQVEGSEPWDQARLASIVSKQLTGVPCALINRYHVESQVMENPAIKSAELDRNIFGSAVLSLTYHRPVARFYNHLNMALGDDGVVFRSGRVPEGLPTLQLFEGQMKTDATLATDFPSLAISQLAIQVSQIFPGQSVRIEYGTGSSLCLNIGTSQVILGSCDGLDAKLAKLKEKLAADRNFLSQVKSFNLLEPKNPMTIPK